MQNIFRSGISWLGWVWRWEEIDSPTRHKKITLQLMSFSLCRVLTLTYSRNDLKLFGLVVRTDLLLLLYGAPGRFAEQRLTYLSYLYLNLYL